MCVCNNPFSPSFSVMSTQASDTGPRMAPGGDTIMYATRNVSVPSRAMSSSTMTKLVHRVVPSMLAGNMIRLVSTIKSSLVAVLIQQR